MKKTLCLALSLLLLSGCASALAADIDGAWTYTNAFADLTFHMPQDWWMYPEDMHAELEEATKAAYRAADTGGVDIDAMVSPESSMMYAVAPLGVSAVIIQVESCTYEGAPIDLEMCLTLNLSLLEGVGYTFPVQEEVEIWGHTYVTLQGTVEVDGVTTLAHYYVREQDGYFVIVSVSSSSEAELENLLARIE